MDRAALDDAISRAVGDPATCVLIAERDGGDVVYRYNTATACARALPACDRPQTLTTGDLAAAVARDGQARRLSCSTAPDGSRSVGWAAGPVAGRDLVYAAMMEGDRALPGRIMADRLEAAFRRAGLTPAG